MIMDHIPQKTLHRLVRTHLHHLMPSFYVIRLVAGDDHVLNALHLCRLHPNLPLLDKRTTS